MTETLDATIDLARAESGQLHLEWPLGITESVGEWQRAFNDLFGLDVDVGVESYLESTPTMKKLVGTAEVGAPASTDVFLGPFAHFLRGGPAGLDLFLRVDWEVLAPEWPEAVVATDSLSVVAYHQLVGFAYNTDLLDRADVPRTASDVVRLARARPIASTRGAACFPFLASEDVMGREALLAHLRELRSAKAGLINPADVDSIANGDYVGVWLSPATNFVERARAAGAPVAAVAIDDAAVVVSWDMAIPRNTASPHTAALWTYFMNTRAAQEIAHRTIYADNLLLEGSKLAPAVAAGEEAGARFVCFDNRYGLAHPEAYSAELRLEIIEALGD